MTTAIPANMLCKKMKVLDLNACVNREKAAGALRMTEAEAAGLIDEVLPLLRPRAVLEESFIQERDENSVLIGGARFHSRILSENLRNVEKAFPEQVAMLGMVQELVEIRVQLVGILTVRE